MPAGRVIVVGLGPAGLELITVETMMLLKSGLPVWLRTDRHPAAAAVEAAGSFDDVYDTSESFDDVYNTIVERLVEMATAQNEIVYAVPGSPMVAERTVELLLMDERVETRVHAALSFVELAWMALGIDPMAEVATIIDGHRFAADARGRTGPFLVTQVHSTEVLDDIVMALEDMPPPTVTLLQALGTSDEVVVELPWGDLDASVGPDHLTSLWIPELDAPFGESIGRLVSFVRGRAIHVARLVHRRWPTPRKG